MDHIKQKAKENPYVQWYQVMKKRPQTEAQAQRNMMVYLKNTVGFRLNYFKGMSYDDIRLIFEAKFNANMDFLLKSKEQIEEEENRAIESINETPAQKAVKRRRLNEEAEDIKELKQHLEIVPDEDDDVYTEATPLARKSNVWKNRWKRSSMDESKKCPWSSKADHACRKKIPTLEVYIGSNAKCSKAKSGRANEELSAARQKLMLLDSVAEKFNAAKSRKDFTYTSVSSLVEDYSDIGSPKVDGPPSPDNVPGPEEPEQAPLSPNYYMPPEDDVFPAEEQPLPVAATPTADSPGYISEFDPNGDLEEDDEEDPKEDLADYPADFKVVALPAVNHVPSEEVTKPLPQIPSPPLLTPSPPPDSPTHIEIPKSCLPLRKRLRFASPTPSQEVGESSTVGAARQDEPAVARDDPYSLVREELYGFIDSVDVALGRPLSKELGYGITDTWDELVGASEEIAPTTLQGVNQRVIDLSSIVKQETTIIYDKERKREARMAHKSWELSMDASENAHLDVMSLRTTLVAHHGLILDLLAVDRRRQGVIKELLAVDHKRQVQLTKALRLLKGLQTQMIELQKHHGLTKGPAQPDAPGEAMIDQGVTSALAARDKNRNEDDSHTSGMGRPVQVTCECTYLEFLKCQPLNFKGTEGVVGLSQWGKIKKLESEMSNLKVKGTDVVAYIQHFQELALMCDQMFLEEIDKVERYVDGLTYTIHGSMMATKPKTMQDVIDFATELMNKKINTWAERQANNKGKSDDTTQNNQQQPNKRQNTGRAYAAENGERKEYAGTLPLCNKCKFHHNGQCTIKNPTYYECGNQGHYGSDCLELKNQDHGNQAGGTRAYGMLHALEGGETNQDLNDAEDDMNA
nr:hypothetical protein [Tanacetum cinerariifolium]